MEAIDTIPSDLGTVYRETMMRIENSKDKDLADKILSWTLYCPSPLTMDELRSALSIREGDTNFEEDYVPSPDGLIECCHGLILMEPTTGLIKFTHSTVQEFLNSYSLSNTSISLAKIYFTCLEFHELRESLISFHVQFEINKFCHYAARYWADHIRGPMESSPDIQHAVLSLLENDEKRETVQQMGRHATAPWSVKFFSKQSMLDIVAEKGLATIFELILESKRDEDNLETALHYAASGGHVKIIKAVLQRNKDTAGMIDHKGQTALHWAALRGHEQIVEVLLAVNPNLAIVQDAKGWTALHLAAMRGDDDVINKLLEYNVSAAELRDKEEKTPLDWARRWRRDTVVNILSTRKRASVEAKGHYMQPNLADDHKFCDASGASDASQNIIPVTLANAPKHLGASATTFIPEQQRAWTHMGISANLFSVSTYSGTSKSLSVDNVGRPPRAFAFLPEKHPNPRRIRDDLTKKSSLRKAGALSNKPRSTVQINDNGIRDDLTKKSSLRKAGALSKKPRSTVQIDDKVTEIPTPVFSAIAEETGISMSSSSMPSEVSDSSATASKDRADNPEHAVGDGSTQMHAAAVNGHVEAIKALKEAGADVVAKRANGSTPMHSAALNGHVDAIKALKEAGADVTIIGSDNIALLVRLMNLGIKYGKQGRCDDAITILEIAEKMSKQLLGTEHTDTLRTMNALAVAYRDMGRLADAMLLFEIVEGVQKRKLGSTHPETLETIRLQELVHQKIQQSIIILIIEAKYSEFHPPHPYSGFSNLDI